jgi:hypothetical protein
MVGMGNALSGYRRSLIERRGPEGKPAALV